jgi:extracellular elastinolytic metalloproteinase
MIDALISQPCNPTFINARDAVIQADANRYNGANKCTLWKAFAKRGLGYGASLLTFSLSHIFLTLYPH